MARGTKTPARTTPAPKAGARSAKPATTEAKGPAKALIERAAVVSKDELRAQVEKLERTNATLRAKSRETTKAAKAAAARIAELEDEVAALEKQVASAKRGAKRATARERTIDPVDAVLPGAAVAEPEPLNEEAETVLGNFEEHLRESSETDQSGR